jgi:hypothetical protein
MSIDKNSLLSWLGVKLIYFSIFISRKISNVARESPNIKG